MNIKELEENLNNLTVLNSKSSSEVISFEIVEEKIYLMRDSLESTKQEISYKNFCLALIENCLHSEKGKELIVKTAVSI